MIASSMRRSLVNAATLTAQCTRPASSHATRTLCALCTKRALHSSHLQPQSSCTSLHTAQSVTQQQPKRLSAAARVSARAVGVPVRHVWAHIQGNLQSACDASPEDIPIIDLSPLLALPPRDKSHTKQDWEDMSPELERCIASLHDACVNTGFFYIAHHGVPQQLVDSVLTESRRFFAQSTEFKMRISCADTPNRGYFGADGENLGEKTKADLKECVDMGVDVSPEEAQKNDMRKPNKWPDAQTLPGYRPAMEHYFAAMTHLSEHLTRGLAMALRCPHSSLTALTVDAMRSMRILHYPPQAASSVDSENLGSGSHTDYGLLTVLAQSSSGLQVQRRDGQWLKAPVVDAAFIVNLADMLPRLTNDYFKSTPHRVLNTSSVPLDRYSVAYFYEPSMDAVVQTLPQFVTKDKPLHYEPIEFAQHLKHMFEHSYKRPKQKPSSD